MQRNREAFPEAERTKTSHTGEDRQNQGTIPMPTFATRPSTITSIIFVEFQQNSMVGQQRQQSTNSPILNHPWFGRSTEGFKEIKL